MMAPFGPAGAGIPVRIVVPGAIVAWKRAQRRISAMARTVTFTDRDVAAYHSTVRAGRRAGDGWPPPIIGAIEMSVVAVFRCQQSGQQNGEHTRSTGEIAKMSKPDIENSVKGAMDALQSIVYETTGRSSA